MGTAGVGRASWITRRLKEDGFTPSFSEGRKGFSVSASSDSIISIQWLSDEKVDWRGRDEEQRLVRLEELRAKEKDTRLAMLAQYRGALEYRGYIVHAHSLGDGIIYVTRPEWG